jgi:hypothetical protein
MFDKILGSIDPLNLFLNTLVALVFGCIIFWPDDDPSVRRYSLSPPPAQTSASAEAR